MTALTKIEMQLAEPSSNTEPFELGRDECRILERALAHYREHHDRLRWELMALDQKQAAYDLGALRGSIHALEGKIADALSITLTPDA